MMLCLLVAACASEKALVSTNPSLQVSTKGLPAPDATQSSQLVNEYRIGPMDLLNINVFGVTDLTQEVRVDSLGNITMPLIRSVHAGGRTPGELQDEIAAKLSSGYLQSPQVSVFVKEYTSQRITVEGAVEKPGVFPIMGPTTLLQAIATSGGLQDMADRKGVVIFRTINGQKMGAVYDVNAISHGAVDDPMLYRDDLVVVEQSGSRTRLRQFIQATPLFYVFHIATGI
jgi:polysaccharide export outer membrane protein